MQSWLDGGFWLIHVNGCCKRLHEKLSSLFRILEGGGSGEGGGSDRRLKKYSVPVVLNLKVLPNSEK